MSRMNVVLGQCRRAGAWLAVLAIAAAALATGAASASAPYDLRGIWNTFGSGGGYSGTFTIASMNLATGAFSGTGDGTTFALKGVERGSTVSFTQSTGAYVSHDTATVVRRGGTLQMTAGSWHDSNGAGGTFTAGLKSSASAPAPVAGASVAAGTVSGTVLVRPPGATAFSALGATALIPVGSTVDATRGRVRLTSAAAGHRYTGQFYGGEFTLSESAAGVTKLTLAGGVPCAAGASAASRGPARKRSLWGDAHGRFETSGHYAAATELGTRWLTADRCTGTLIRVAAGAVRVSDLVRHRSFVLRAPGRRLVRS
jgi:hypothetical protein